MRGFFTKGLERDAGPEFIGGPDVSSGPSFGAFGSALPFDSQPADVIDVDLSTVNPLAGIAPTGAPIIPTQDVWNDLEAIRGKMPWLPIITFPPVILTAFMTAANAPLEIDIPTGAAFVRFRGPGDFYVSVGGRAVVPTVQGVLDASTYYKPDDFFYCGGVKQVSVVSASANAIVQAAFWLK